MPLLIDTSIWIDHIRAPDGELSAALNSGQVVVHPFVLGEIAVGSIANRAEVLSSIDLLPKAIVAEDREVLEMLDRHRLFGVGIGYIDAHLLASTLLTPDATLWSRDRRLSAAAVLLDIAAYPQS